MKLRVLIGCECSGVVREAFRALGHDAWSCDLKPAEDGSPFHIQGDVRHHLADGWDIGVFHPVCRFLANSGGKHLYAGMKKGNGINPERIAGLTLGAIFYRDLWEADIPHVCVENPIWHSTATAVIHALCPGHPAKRQFVQPWMFGHLEIKATGLALRNLPPLVETNNVKAETYALPYGQRAKVHHMAPGPEREADRSRTLTGLGEAMAAQWSAYVLALREQKRDAA